jgi:hypothetical protein
MAQQVEAATQRPFGRPPKKVSQVAWIAADQGQEVVSEAAEQAQAVAGAAVEQARQVGSLAADHAQKLIETTKAEAGRVTEEVSAQAHSLVDELKGQVEVQTEEAARRVAHGCGQLAAEAQALAEGRPSEAPNLAEYVWQAADRLYSVSDGLEGIVKTIDERGLEGLAAEVQSFARRRPAAFLLGATIAGFGIGRIVRSGSSNQQGSGPDERLTVPDPRRPGSNGDQALRTGGGR